MLTLLSYIRITTNQYMIMRDDDSIDKGQFQAKIS